ncbi:MAG: LamG domain-containing protein, partial [Phycisphaerales bacterium]
VYMGDNFDDVNNATPVDPTFQGNQTTTMFIAGFFGFAYPEGLVPGTTYYWRVDEVNPDDPNSPWKGDVWSFWIPPRVAWEPAPADGVNYVATDAELSWTPGFGAQLHTVYFGENLDEVSNATGGTAQSTTTFSPGPLTNDTVYYWRVDEFEAPITHKGDVWSFRTMPEIPIVDPNLVGWWKFDEGDGTVVVDWSGHGNHGVLESDRQSVPGYDGEAIEFDGASNTVLLGAGPSLSGTTDFSTSAWIRKSAASAGVIIQQRNGGYNGEYRFMVNGNGQLSLMIYGDSDYQYDFSTAMTVNDGSWHHVAAVRQGPSGYIYVDGKLEASDTGTVRSLDSSIQVGIGADIRDSVNYFNGAIDDVRLYDKALTQDEIKQVMRGDPLLAWGPQPQRHASVDIRDIDSLSWSAGDTAVSHDVYFGTDRDAVALADNTSPEFQGNQAGTSLSLAGLVEFGGGDYYWRIDEVAADGTVTAGTIWKFTVPDYLIVDDFESYNDIEEGQPGSNRVYLTWIDGYGTTTNGAVAGNLDPPFMSQGHNSAQAMPLSYDNAGKTSEATKTLEAKKDWTAHGVTKLVVWFRGDSANAAERMFVALGNTVVYHPDDAATQDTGWNEWVIDLTEFAGVDLTNVPSMTIGFGTRGAPVPTGGTGTVHFDDIGLIR